MAYKFGKHKAFLDFHRNRTHALLPVAIHAFLFLLCVLPRVSSLKFNNILSV
jgi:hypothetical protein